MNITKTPISENFGLTFLGSKDADIFALSRDQVIDCFKSSGCLLFRGFELDAEKFKNFTNLFSTSYMSYLGGAILREAINGDKTVLAVTGSKHRFAVPLHGEMYYMKHRPTLIWFYCDTPALSQGETTLCDGSQFYEEMSQTSQELFNTKRLKYIRSYPNGLWQKIYHTDDINIVENVCKKNMITIKVNPEDMSIRTESIRPAIFQSKYGGKKKFFINNILPLLAGIMGETKSFIRFEDDSEIPVHIQHELKAIAEKLTISISWQQGDILMIDNTRILHGRKAYFDNQRNIYVRLCDSVF
ncbi:MAG: TauD/TfdA family dioxygenase [Xenococcaceae cyanobacterium]